MAPVRSKTPHVACNLCARRESALCVMMYTLYSLGSAFITLVINDSFLWEATCKLIMLFFVTLFLFTYCDELLKSLVYEKGF